jgi:hypothetical protein
VEIDGCGGRVISWNVSWPRTLQNLVGGASLLPMVIAQRPRWRNLRSVNWHTKDIGLVEWCWAAAPDSEDRVAVHGTSAGYLLYSRGLFHRLTLSAGKRVARQAGFRSMYNMSARDSCSRVPAALNSCRLFVASCNFYQKHHRESRDNLSLAFNYFCLKVLRSCSLRLSALMVVSF